MDQDPLVGGKRESEGRNGGNSTKPYKLNPGSFYLRTFGLSLEKRGKPKWGRKRKLESLITSPKKKSMLVSLPKKKSMLVSLPQTRRACTRYVKMFPIPIFMVGDFITCWLVFGIFFKIFFRVLDDRLSWSGLFFFKIILFFVTGNIKMYGWNLLMNEQMHKTTFLG